jgi:hypothetical protein
MNLVGRNLQRSWYGFRDLCRRTSAVDVQEQNTIDLLLVSLSPSLCYRLILSLLTLSLHLVLSSLLSSFSLSVSLILHDRLLVTHAYLYYLCYWFFRNQRLSRPNVPLLVHLVEISNNNTHRGHTFPPFYACYLLKSIRTPRSTA